MDREREYFDAKFEGLEKLMRESQRNMENHIGAVSSNVKRVESALADHKENAEAHGRGAADKGASGIVGWLGLALAAGLAALEIRKGGH